MTTVTMTGMWVQWDQAHTTVTGFGQVQMSLIGNPVLSYTYQDGWTGGTAPPVRLLPGIDNEVFDFGDGTVRRISDVADGTSNTIFLGETGGDTPFSGTVLGVSDTGGGVDYYFGLDAALPFIEPLDTDGTVRFINELTTGAGQIRGGSFAPGVGIITDGTSNTISFGEADDLRGDGRAQYYDGGLGGDRLDGAGGADTLLGGKGGDLVSGDAGADLCHGGVGADTIEGGRGNDQLFGGDPRLPDAAGADRLYGGAGQDSLYGGAGGDHYDGGEGADGIFLGGGADYLVFGGGSGRDTVWDFGTGDIVGIRSDVLTGQTTGAEVIRDFGTVLGDGSVRFIFDGDTLTMMANGDNLDGLAAQIEVFG